MCNPVPLRHEAPRSESSVGGLGQHTPFIMLGFMAAIPSHMHATGADCDLTGLPDGSTIVMKYDPL